VNRNDTLPNDQQYLSLKNYPRKGAKFLKIISGFAPFATLRE
jgi:hypothetical protein